MIRPTRSLVLVCSLVLNACGGMDASPDDANPRDVRAGATDSASRADTTTVRDATSLVEDTGTRSDDGGTTERDSAAGEDVARAHDGGAGDSARRDASPPVDATTPTVDSGPATTDGGRQPAYCATSPWTNLAACGWPGPGNTGPDLTACPGGLAPMGGSVTSTMNIATAGTVINCRAITGALRITAAHVTVRNCTIRYDSGHRGTDANGTAPITVDDGASAVIDHVAVDGMNAVHACVWHQGTSLEVHAMDCHGVNDGVFSWADTHYASTTGDHFTVDTSWFHDFTTATANGHEDGYQTEGASHGVIRHNTFDLTTEADSAIAIWDSLKSSTDILVDDNLIAGGGAAIYADDYSPSETGPMGGFSVTDITFTNNRFSTHVAPCVGSYFIWYARPSEPYGGGPSDGWHRSGNVVIETGENVDASNPHAHGALCT